jgi:serine protease
MIRSQHVLGRPRHAAAVLCATLAALSVSLASAQQTEPPQRIIVKWKETPLQLDRSANAARTSDAAARFGTVLSKVNDTAAGAQVLSADRNLTRSELNELMETLRGDPDVAYVEEDLRMQAVFVPNDPSYNQQGHYFNAVSGIGLPATWDLTKGLGIRVAVLDTGYRPHADLAANIVTGYDFISDLVTAQDGTGRDTSALDPGDYHNPGECGGSVQSSWHGTHVAGTVAAVTNNALGVAGVAHAAKVVPVRVLGRCGGFTSDIADGVIWASGASVANVPANPNPAHVINLSLGGFGPCSATMQNAINIARARRAVIVVAAGNSNVDATGFSPANCSGVITVAATDGSGGKASFSNFGSIVDIAAPGTSVLSTLNNGVTTPGADSYAFYQGTSMATPHVAGSAALLLSIRPSLTSNQVESALKSTARAFPAACALCGIGIVNPRQAVANSLPLTDLVSPGVQISNLHGGAGLEYRYAINVPSGATNLTFRILGGAGDADLYVQPGLEPTTTAWTCRPFSSTSIETCSFAVPTPGIYFVMVRGFSEFSGVPFVANYTP